MNPSLILFFNIVAGAVIAYMMYGLLAGIVIRAYYARRGFSAEVSLRWWTIPSMVVAAAWLSVFSGLSFGG